MFLMKPVKVDKYYHKRFSPQNEPPSAKLCFSVVFKHFWGNSLKNSLFIKKSDISERNSEIIRKINFLNKFEKEKIQGKIWSWCKHFFLFKAVKWDNF